MIRGVSGAAKHPLFQPGRELPHISLEPLSILCPSLDELSPSQPRTAKLPLSQQQHGADVHFIIDSFHRIHRTLEPKSSLLTPSQTGSGAAASQSGTATELPPSNSGDTKFLPFQHFLRSFSFVTVRGSQALSVRA